MCPSQYLSCSLKTLPNAAPPALRLLMLDMLQGQAVLEGAVERVLGDVLKAMHVPALRSPVEQHLHRLAGTLHFAAAIPNLQVFQWLQHCVRSALQGLSHGVQA